MTNKFNTINTLFSGELDATKFPTGYYAVENKSNQILTLNLAILGYATIVSPTPIKSLDEYFINRVNSKYMYSIRILSSDEYNQLKDLNDRILKLYEDHKYYYPTKPISYKTLGLNLFDEYEVWDYKDIKVIYDDYYKNYYLLLNYNNPDISKRQLIGIFPTELHVYNYKSDDEGYYKEYYDEEYSAYIIPYRYCQNNFEKILHLFNNSTIYDNKDKEYSEVINYLFF